MKNSFLFCSLFLSYQALAAPVDSCNNSIQADQHDTLCSEIQSIGRELSVEGEIPLVISGENLSIKYVASVFKEEQGNGEVALNSKQIVKLEELDINFRYKECDENQCTLNNYIEYLHNTFDNKGSFLSLIASDGNKKKIKDAITKDLLASGLSISSAAITSAFNSFWNKREKLMYFKFLDPDSEALAYIRADIEQAGNINLSEYIYRDTESDEISWIGNKDYDLNASEALWRFLWESELRRVKRCVSSEVTILKTDNDIRSFPGTQCWYANRP